MAFYNLMTCEKKVTTYEYARHELHSDATKEVFEDSLAWVESKLESAPLLGDLPEKFRTGHLRKQEPWQHKGKLIFLAIFIYYMIGFLLMETQTIFKNRHGQQLISWPVALWRWFRK